MEINLGDEVICELEAAFSPQQLQEKALSRRADAFGQMARLIQRPKPEDIEITTTQKRLEPFWFSAATARYVYDRRHVYQVATPPEVHSVSVDGNEHAVQAEDGSAFSIEAIDHCVEQVHQELILDGSTGNEAVKFGKYLGFGQHTVSDLASLEQAGAEVIQPEVRSSFVVRKLAAMLMKTFQADKVLEERIDVERIVLYFRPVFAVEYLWKAKDKRQVLEFDGLTGDARPESGELKKHVMRVLENDALFDIGADVVGTVFPGVNVAVKVGRLAARKAIR